MSRRGPGREEDEDSLLGGRVRLRQPASGYRVAIDPVFLAAAVPARPDSRVLDLGSGCGKICFIASQVVGPEGRVIGVDMTHEMLDTARQNAPLVGEKIGSPASVTSPLATAIAKTSSTKQL